MSKFIIIAIVSILSIGTVACNDGDKAEPASSATKPCKASTNKARCRANRSELQQAMNLAD
jgi:hypothetical protein